MAKIHVDGQAFEVDGTQNLLHTCLSLGFDLEYFCWHPALGSVGACRQCAVKQFKDEADERAGTGKIVMACMTPAADGTRISIRDPEAVAFRAGIIEGLMLNHPHDCPVCDEGGECHLQDMTVMTGHSYRRNRFAKRTFRNQQLGPCLDHEMNRCIQCYRCVRFYREHAGGHDLNVFGLRNLTYFGRTEDGTLESEWSGNLAEVCPTGVFTDATLGRHYTRRWDLQMTPSVCGHCGLGCNITLAQRTGSLRRTVNRYHGQVNGYFICDRGRYAYEFAQSEARLRTSVNDDDIVTRLARSVDKRTIGIGSPRASLEANFALRALVGPDQFFMGMADGEASLVALALDLARKGSARVPTIHEASQADAVLVLGEDLPNVAPRLALAVRQAVRQRSFEHARRHHIPVWLDQAVRNLAQDERSPLFVFTPFATRLDDVATIAGRTAPDDMARLGFAVAHVIDASMPDVANLDPTQRHQAEDMASRLLAAQRPLVVSGPSLGSESVMRAAAAVAQALCNQGRAAALAFTAPECNSVGASFFGAGRLVAAFERVAIGNGSRIVVLENDLYRRAPASEVDKLFERATEIVVLDCVRTRTSERATLAIPSASWAESDGTLVSNETRAQRFFQALAPAAPVRASWRWLAQSLVAAGRAEWRTLDQVIAALTAEIPALAPITHAAPSADFRLNGAKIPRAPHRESGRTAESANIHVQDSPPPPDPDSALTFSMEGTARQPPAPLVPFFWSPGWNSIQALNKFQEEIAGPLRGGDAGVRLIDHAKSETAFDAGSVPAPFSLRPGQLWVVPRFQIFGSDELSRHAPAIAARTPPVALTVHPEDGAALRVLAGDSVDVRSDNQAVRVSVDFSDAVARGTAALSAGYPETLGLRLPAWIRILRP
jgi:NADH-quinone oxidoreductase subunit G